MSEGEYRCFVGGLSWSTTDRDLKEAFQKFGGLLEASVKISSTSFDYWLTYKFNRIFPSLSGL